MKKFLLLILTLTLFSCQNTQNQENNNNSGVVENSGKVEKDIGDCIDIVYGDFIFLVNNTCYSLGYQSEEKPISYFYLYSENEVDGNGHINLLNKDFEKDSKDFRKKYNLGDDTMVFNYMVYSDIVGHYTKILRNLGIKELPQTPLVGNVTINDVENSIYFKYFRIRKNFLFSKDKNFADLQYLMISDLYKEISNSLDYFKQEKDGSILHESSNKTDEQILLEYKEFTIEQKKNFYNIIEEISKN